MIGIRGSITLIANIIIKGKIYWKKEKIVVKLEDTIKGLIQCLFFLEKIARKP
jgi:hypothetical protein